MAVAAAGALRSGWLEVLVRGRWHKVLGNLYESSLVLSSPERPEDAPSSNGMTNGTNSSPQGVRTAFTELPDTVPEAIANKKRAVKVVKQELCRAECIAQCRAECIAQCRAQCIAQYPYSCSSPQRRQMSVCAMANPAEPLMRKKAECCLGSRSVPSSKKLVLCLPWHSPVPTLGSTLACVTCWPLLAQRSQASPSFAPPRRNRQQRD
ncbi:uncharacterized protein LOC116411753 [Xenopus tropicalis]|uniref:Uncharacterized protein LOC116411753 n=1 Tax=Xenopus tropicalis TaxID=8364 RepID=A0A8J1JV49_XENTR|nr:uncharacterized protein LOC116411753 [Xenopus tropicalis]